MSKPFEDKDGKWIGLGKKVIGYDDPNTGSGLNVMIVLILRFSIVGYVAFAIFSATSPVGYHLYIFGYNLFFLTGMIGVLMILYEAIRSNTRRIR
tara:strand:- start:117 stop:401 length:285 start_codon:yes stop_codon:yes gene_type:complete